jgi:hypothetical protein
MLIWNCNTSSCEIEIQRLKNRSSCLKQLARTTKSTNLRTSERVCACGPAWRKASKQLKIWVLSQIIF